MIIQKTQRIYGGVEAEEFIIGASNCNSYYPIYLFGDGTLEALVADVIYEDLFTYNKIKPTRTTTIKYSLFFSTLKSELRGRRFEIRLVEGLDYIRVGKGFISNDKGEIMMILCKKKPTITASSASYDKDNLVLFVAHEFAETPNYKNIYRKWVKDYLSLFTEKGMDVFLMSSAKIEEQIFKNAFKFDSKSLIEIKNEIDNFSIVERSRRVSILEASFNEVFVDEGPLAWMEEFNDWIPEEGGEGLMAADYAQVVEPTAHVSLGETPDDWAQVEAILAREELRSNRPPLPSIGIIEQIESAELSNYPGNQEDILTALEDFSSAIEDEIEREIEGEIEDFDESNFI